MYDDGDYDQMIVVAMVMVVLVLVVIVMFSNWCYCSFILHLF